jgi:hypothetical protein
MAAPPLLRSADRDATGVLTLTNRGRAVLRAMLPDLSWCMKKRRLVAYPTQHVIPSSLSRRRAA